MSSHSNSLPEVRKPDTASCAKAAVGHLRFIDAQMTDCFFVLLKKVGVGGVGIPHQNKVKNKAFVPDYVPKTCEYVKPIG